MLSFPAYLEGGFFLREKTLLRNDSAHGNRGTPVFGALKWKSHPVRMALVVLVAVNT
jgi:hypothetical protein